MTYLLIRKTTFGKMFSDKFDVLEQSKDIKEIQKKKDAHEILKKKDESFNIVMFETNTDPVSVAQDQDFNFNQLELPLPFPERQ